MHELSVASSLVELASAYAARQGAHRISRVQVRIGVLQHIARSLYFCFGNVARGTPCEGAILEVEEVRLTVECPVCCAEKTPGGLYNFRCPDCGSATHRVITGRELQLVAITLPTESAIPLDTARPPPANNDLSTARRLL
jgi:hydrogenase nickel incorporation protein HypA/HybF